MRLLALLAWAAGLASAGVSRSFRNVSGLASLQTARSCGPSFCVETLFYGTQMKPAIGGRTPQQLAALANVAASDLSAWRLYPNPVRASENARLTFDRMPSGARVRIFTVSGRLVAEGASDGGGRFEWDLRNGDGAPAASGVYLAVASHPGGKAVRRLAILR